MAMSVRSLRALALALLVAAGLMCRSFPSFTPLHATHHQPHHRGMRLFLDTADVEQYKNFLGLGVFHGVTTNPTTLQDAKEPCTVESLDHIHRLAKKYWKRPPHFNRHEEFMCQTWGGTEDELYKTGVALSKLDRSRMVVKVPATKKGISVARRLHQSDVRVCLTGCYSAKQALLAASLGVEYVAPYLGRMTDKGKDGLEECIKMQEIMESLECETRVLVASVRNPDDMVELARRGVNTFTFCPEVAEQLFSDPLTEDAAAEFEAAVKNRVSARVVSARGPGARLAALIGMAADRGGVLVTLVTDNDQPSKSFELPSGEERRIRLGRAKENDLVIEQKGTSWFHCELRLLEPERRGSGALVKLRDTSTNGVGMKAPGASTIRITKGIDHPVVDGTVIIVPFKVKAEDGKSQEELRSSVKVCVSGFGALGAEPKPKAAPLESPKVDLEPPPLPKAQAPTILTRTPEKEVPPPVPEVGKKSQALQPKAAASKPAAARPKASRPTFPREEPPKAASAKSQSRPPAREVRHIGQVPMEEDYPPAIPAATG
ncbi:unnamed protein product, partial [Effrenium voratum]